MQKKLNAGEAFASVTRVSINYTVTADPVEVSLVGGPTT